MARCAVYPGDMSGVDAYVQHVDRLLAGARGLFPDDGSAVRGPSEEPAGPLVAPDEASGLGSTMAQASSGYHGARSRAVDVSADMQAVAACGARGRSRSGRDCRRDPAGGGGTRRGNTSGDRLAGGSGAAGNPHGRVSGADARPPRGKQDGASGLGEKGSGARPRPNCSRVPLARLFAGVLFWGVVVGGGGVLGCGVWAVRV